MSPESGYSTQRTVQSQVIVDPRAGDVEDDHSSTKNRSFLSLAGTLLAEISLPKLAVAWLLLIIVPALALGLAPVVASAWVSNVSRKLGSPILGFWPLLLLGILIVFAWYGGRTIYRMAETGFWTLNSVIVEPGYVTCREFLRHFIEALVPLDRNGTGFARLRGGTAFLAGLIVSGLAIFIADLAWPWSHWTAELSDFGAPYRLAGAALANGVVLIAAYFAAASLFWGIADASMAQPRDLDGFAAAPSAHAWRIAHVSDIHVVGERYGFRIESGRSGPRGNERVRQIMAHLEALRAKEKLDLILVTGDMTDAGSSAEWAEFLDLMAVYPRLAERMLVLPGNHDINIVDRANPARFDTPASPKSRLRKVRALSAMNALQGQRVHVVDHAKRRVGATLAQVLERHSAEMTRFADVARPRFSTALARLWNEVFPMVLLPDRPDGLGVILLNSNADTHFSFTNALGMIATEQVKGIEIAMAQYPQACWVIALHHHMVEYPQPAKALSDRIGTALINGNWFVRRLLPFAHRVVVMHGHRHTDWIGTCAGLITVSAPSPVMETTNHLSYFWIHTVAKAEAGRLRLLAPERISLAAQPNALDAKAHSATGGSHAAK